MFLKPNTNRLLKKRIWSPHRHRLTLPTLSFSGAMRTRHSSTAVESCKTILYLTYGYFRLVSATFITHEHVDMSPQTAAPWMHPEWFCESCRPNYMYREKKGLEFLSLVALRWPQQWISKAVTVLVKSLLLLSDIAAVLLDPLLLSTAVRQPRQPLPALSGSTCSF